MEKRTIESLEDNSLTIEEQNMAYLQKLEKSIQQAREGKFVIKSMEELEKLAKE